MLNFIVIQGNFVADPVLSETKKKKNSVVNARIACKRDAKGTGRDADFFRVTFWGSLAEYVSKEFKKGDNITVEGRLEEMPHTSKDGHTFSFIEINATRIRPGVTNEMRRLIRESKHAAEETHADEGSQKSAESSDSENA